MVYDFQHSFGDITTITPDEEGHLSFLRETGKRDYEFTLPASFLLKPVLQARGVTRAALEEVVASTPGEDTLYPEDVVLALCAFLGVDPELP